MSNLRNFIATTIKEYLTEISKIKSTNNFEMFELLKKLPFIKYVDRPSGKFLHNIDLVLVDETNIDDLNNVLDGNNWYLERGWGKSFTITQKYVDEAKVKIPRVLYHITLSRNVDGILKYGLKRKSEDLSHKYPPRIYVSDNMTSLKSLEKEFKKRKGDEEYSIIKIDTSGLDFDLYIDDTSAYQGHYYIQGIDKIPNKNLELVK
jgi:hypothetical protein